MRRRRAFLACLAALTTAFGALAEGERKPQPLSFLSAVETSEVQLGRPFVLRVEIRHAARERYRLPADLELPDVVVRRRSEESVAEQQEGIVRTTFRIEGVVYDRLGEIEFPEIRVEVEDEAGPLSPLLVPGARLRILEVGAGTELEPPPDPLPVTVFAWERLAIAAALLAVSIAAWVFWRRRAAKRVEKSPRPPIEVALEELGRLRALPPADREAGRHYYFRLSEILRVYLRDAHGLAAPEMTSDELCAALRRWPIPGLQAERLEAWLRRGDLVRFARVEVVADEAIRDCDEARAMIEAMEAARAREVVGA